MPPGLLQQTTPGWVLAIYRTTEGERDPDRDPVIVRNTVVLVSPAGESYRVLELPTDQWAELLRWEAGSTTAVVGMFGHGQPTDAARAVLDLESGVLTPTELGLGTTELYANYYQGQAADGAELWTVVTGSDAFTSDVYRVTENADPELVGMIGLDGLLDPSRRWLVSNVPSTEPVEPFALLDVVDGSRTEHSYGVPGQDCDVVGWLDPGQLLAFCLDAGYREAGIADPVAAHAAYYRIDVSPSAATPTLLARLGPSDPRPQTWRGGWAAPGTLAFGATSAGLDDLVSCPEAVYLWSGQEAVLTAIPHGARSYSVDSGLPLPSSSATGCEGDPETLQSFDPSTGASTVLAPEPLPAGDGTGATGVASWVVGS
jgi:hypothetical protein